MTVSSAVNRCDYVSNGVATSYAYTFLILAVTDLLVTMQDTSGNLTTLVLNTDYTVDSPGIAGGGNVNLLTSATLPGGVIPNLYLLNIRRVRPLTQVTSIRNQGPYFPEVIEQAFDNCAMVDQQIQDELSSAVVLAPTILPSNFNPQLPALLPPNTTIIVNPAGNGFATGATEAAIIAAAVAAAVAAVGGMPAGETDFAMVNNQAVPADITGLAPGAFKSVSVEIAVSRTSGTPTEYRERVWFNLVYYKNSATWVLEGQRRSGDNTGFEVSVVPETGQVQYTTINNPGGSNVDLLAFRMTGFISA